MKLVKSPQKKNSRYYVNMASKPIGIMVHEIACPQESPTVFVRGWNKSGISKAVHAFIGNGVVYECLRCNPGSVSSGWHAGGSANRNMISFEMCEYAGTEWPKPYIAKVPSGKQKEFDEFEIGVYNTAVEYVAYKCKQFGWVPNSKHVFSHKEGHAKGVASGHGDPDEVWKLVKSKKLTMDGFRADVAKAMGKVSKPSNVVRQSDSVTSVIKSLQNALNKDYGCKLAVDGFYGPKTEKALARHNIRKGSNRNSVKWLQTKLNAKGFTDAKGNKLDVDGDFGAKTAAALKKAQSKLGCKQDAEFGTGTFEKFIKLF